MFYASSNILSISVLLLLIINDVKSSTIHDDPILNNSSSLDVPFTLEDPILSNSTSLDVPIINSTTLEDPILNNSTPLDDPIINSTTQDLILNNSTSFDDPILNNSTPSEYLNDQPHPTKNKEEALLYSHPFMVSLQEDHIHYCTGTLISTQHVLTSAQCLFYKSYEDWDLRKPSQTFAVTGCFEDGCPLPVAAKEFIFHPFFFPNNRSNINDIALVKLEHSLGGEIRVLDISTEVAQKKPTAESKCLLIKWTNSNNLGTDLRNLKKRLLIKHVQIENDVMCTKYRTRKKYHSSINLCGLGASEACEADIGSPLFCDSKQVGILSFGFSCNNKAPQRPVVLTRVDPYYQWIAENAVRKLTYSSILIVTNIQFFLFTYLLS